MAHFYGEFSGGGAALRRCGTAASGMRAHLRGWGLGIESQIGTDVAGGDVVSVWLTSGSGGESRSLLLGTYTKEDLENLDEQPVKKKILNRTLPRLQPRVVEA
jgi:hypothetical protein